MLHTTMAGQVGFVFVRLSTNITNKWPNFRMLLKMKLQTTFKRENFTTDVTHRTFGIRTMEQSIMAIETGIRFESPSTFVTEMLEIRTVFQIHVGFQNLLCIKVDTTQRTGASGRSISVRPFVSLQILTCWVHYVAFWTSKFVSKAFHDIEQGLGLSVICRYSVFTWPKQENRVFRKVNTHRIWNSKTWQSIVEEVVLWLLLVFCSTLVNNGK